MLERIAQMAQQKGFIVAQQSSEAIWVFNNFNGYVRFTINQRDPWVKRISLSLPIDFKNRRLIAVFDDCKGPAFTDSDWQRDFFKDIIEAVKTQSIDVLLTQYKEFKAI